jgi:hypothetical protein
MFTLKGVVILFALRCGWSRAISGAARPPEIPAALEKGDFTMTNDQKTWETPTLTVYGDVVALTLKDKHTGTSDGFTFNGVPISG